MTREEMQQRDNDLCKALRSLERAINNTEAAQYMVRKAAEFIQECGKLEEGLQAQLEQIRESADQMHAEAVRIETELEGKE